ncbi:MAG: hypothetical protein AAF798_18165 [Bacteroidota bacterium]
MNNRNIKLALTVGLMNHSEQADALPTIVNLMGKFQKEVGNYLGFSVKKNAPLNTRHIKQTYAMQFENCRLDVDLISNAATQSQVIQNFQLHR